MIKPMHTAIETQDAKIYSEDFLMVYKMMLPGFRLNTTKNPMTKMKLYLIL